MEAIADLANNGGVQVDTLPPFANKENKQLFYEIEELTAKLRDVDNQIEGEGSRLQLLQEHVKNVDTELKHTQLRVEAKNKEVETEKHILELCKRELGKLTKDQKRSVVCQDEAKEKLQQQQSYLIKGKQKIDQFQLLMNWNKEELAQWITAAKQKADDGDALEKYRRQDEAKVRELTLYTERIMKELNGKKAEREQEVTYTQYVQIQLDKAAEDFRQLHVSRQEVALQWEQALERIKGRDAMIQVAAQRFADRKEKMQKLKAILDEKADYQADLEAQNDEILALIKNYEKEVGNLKEDCGRQQTMNSDLESTLEVEKGALSRAAMQLVEIQNKIQSSKQQVDKKKEQLKAATQSNVAIKNQLQAKSNQLEGLEEKITQIENIRLAEQNKLKQVVSHVKQLKQQQFKCNQQLFEDRRMEAEKISEIAGSQSQNKNLSSKIKGLDEEAAKQQEVYYNVEFELQQMQRKYTRATGQRSDDEAKVLKQKISVLSEQLEELQQERGMLDAQVKAVEDDKKHATRRSKSLKQNLVKMNEAINELQLEAKSLQQSVKSCQRQKEDCLVEVDSLKLQVKRLRQLLATKTDQVFGLENRAQQLNLSLEGRKQEISDHLASLRVELGAARNDYHRLIIEYREKEEHIKKIEAKFQVLSQKKFVTGEDQEPKTQAFYIVQAAQEREELQMKGDELDGQVQRAEKELAALQETYKQLEGSNKALNQTFKRVDPMESSEQRKQLRNKLDSAYDNLKALRQEETTMAEDYKNSTDRLYNLNKEFESMQSIVRDLQNRLDQTQADIQDLDQKQQRATNKLNQARSKVRGPHCKPDVAELSAETNILREVALSIAEGLKQIDQENPELSIRLKCEEKGLKLPTRSGPGSLASSASGSVAGSARSEASTVLSTASSLRRAQKQPSVTNVVFQI